MTSRSSRVIERHFCLSTPAKRVTQRLFYSFPEQTISVGSHAGPAMKHVDQFPIGEGFTASHCLFHLFLIYLLLLVFLLLPQVLPTRSI